MTEIFKRFRSEVFQRLHLPAALIVLGLPTSATAQQICVCLRCLTGQALSYYAVAEDMKPTFEVGQCLEAEVWQGGTPNLGQIIAFPHPQTGAVWIKRVVALPGQQVQMIGGRLIINGTGVPTTRVADYEQLFAPEGRDDRFPRCSHPTHEVGETCTIARYTETLGDVTYEVLDLGPSPLDDTPIFVVPDGHVFVLGDHRDNSADSRTSLQTFGIGFVPIDSILGWVETDR